MNKEKVLSILKELNFPKSEFYILSGASLVLRGIRENCSDLDLCVSEELFEQIKDKYNLREENKKEDGLYCVNEILEIAVEPKEKFAIEESEQYNLQDINVILQHKKKRNSEKDKRDIEKNIRSSYEVKDGKLKQTKKGSKEYLKILELLDEKLSEYYVYDNDNVAYDTKEKRLLAPTVVAVYEGEITDIHVGTVGSQDSGYDKLTVDETKELEKIIKNLIDSKNENDYCTQDGC